MYETASNLVVSPTSARSFENRMVTNIILIHLFCGRVYEYLYSYNIKFIVIFTVMRLVI